MTIALALEYIPRRMDELGFEQRYYLRFRHLVLQPQEKLELQAFNQLYILVEEAMDVSVESPTGVFDLSLGNVNEMQYEHQGQLTVTNLSNQLKHIRFIQVIPKHNQTITGNDSSN